MCHVEVVLPERFSIKRTELFFKVVYERFGRWSSEVSREGEDPELGTGAVRRPIEGWEEPLEASGYHVLTPQRLIPASLTDVIRSSSCPGGDRGGGYVGIGADGTCQNQDFLTNLLVYQYLSGSIPGGPSSSHPQLAALLGSQGPATTTVTRVSKTVTTLSVDVAPTTQFTTSTTSYVTTITSVESKVIPVIFRGSKITTTITESNEEVITATEYFTESSVFQPSIVQTLPVHITLTETRTRGLNGQYSVFDVTLGATSVVHEPTTTSTLDLDATGLDLANLDLSQLDLTSLTGGLQGPDIDSQMLAALSSLLQNYDEQAGGDPFSDSTTSSSPSSSSSSGSSSGSNGGVRNFRGPPSRNRNTGASRFSEPQDYTDYEDPVEETPKFNVLRGFTLSDRVASVTSGGSSSSSTGRAATDTRYSKFHRKERVDTNGISTTESSPRENERFSASNRRRTFSRTSDQRRPATIGSSGRAPSTRFVPAVESQYFDEETPSFRPFGQRRDREISTRRRGNLEDRGSSSPPRSRSMPRPRVTTNSIPPIGGIRQEDRSKVPVKPPETPEPSPVGGGLSTVLTMYISGSEPGQFHTRVQTILLRSLGSSRRRRNVNEQPMTKLYSSTATTVSSTSTRIPEMPPVTDPQKIVNLLKTLDPNQVRQMLHSLQKWVDFYSQEVLDESENEILPELTSSLSMESSEVESSATTALPSSPSLLAGVPRASNLCPAPPTFTTTVYRTIVVTSGAEVEVSDIKF
ncbi:mucin-5AC-like [Homarus americanus]|uniref:mucin-5AC-like n=1 Tax=Homarus americanus TaxID=6706 RepID=UPI001C495DC6|nr:mucin-5AC-like [Homarus americanus]